MKRALAAALGGVFLLFPLLAHADPIGVFYTTTTAGTLSGRAVFSVVDDTLFIELTNLSTENEADASRALNGLFWTLAGVTLTAVSAEVAAGSIIQSENCDADVDCATETNVGGEFGYVNATSTLGEVIEALAPEANHGLSSGGYIDQSPNFGGVDLDRPDALGGHNFSIVGSAYDGLNANSGLLRLPLIQSTVLFEFTGAQGLTSGDLSNVSFAYGNDVHLVGAPEPTTLLLMGTGLVAIGIHRYRKRRQASTSKCSVC